HMPLFHILFAPLVRMAGERPDILFIARMAMLPLFAVIALLTYRIGSSVYPRPAAAWATAIGCLVPDFFLCSLEFRTDDLWTVFWLASIALLVSAQLTTARGALAGVMLGLAAAVSAKTSLLAICLGLAAIATHLLALPAAVAFVLAALVPPALIAAYFAARGAWQPFWYCTISHNLVASEHPQRLLLIPVSLAIIVAVARRILRDDAPPEIRKRRLFLFLVAATYGAALISVWPIIETEHWLPFYPLAAVAIVPLLGALSLPGVRQALSLSGEVLSLSGVRQALSLSGVRQALSLSVETRETRQAESLSYTTTTALIALELLRLIQLGIRDNTAPPVHLIAQTMQLTSPDERVVDLKGELLFRRRATYFVFEKITRRAISQGRLRDTIAADVLRTGAMVAVPDNDGFPREGRAFLNRNFIRVGAIRVAGLIVPPTQSFRIEVPGEYSVVAERGEFRGSLDGLPYQRSRYLAAGMHTIAAAGRNAVIWARAAAQGFSPWSDLYFPQGESKWFARAGSSLRRCSPSAAPAVSKSSNRSS
ncbi:MAG TPA: hypothetical protein VII75_13925, partial [Thermoanaerobaculia bacterium]